MTLSASTSVLWDANAERLGVIAGASSGKTNTLAARVVRLVIAGADPQRILLLTFSRRAAAEMAKIIDGTRCRQPVGRADDRPLLLRVVGRRAELRRKSKESETQVATASFL